MMQYRVIGILIFWIIYFQVDDLDTDDPNKLASYKVEDDVSSH